VGYEREVTARAGRMVALSAGASVVFVSSGALTPDEIERLRAVGADLVLLVGGTDGGNATTLLHNAERLARAGLSTPVVVAGNREASGEVHGLLARAGVPSSAADNVLPSIGHLSPESARAAIREAFLTHVIGGKRLSRHAGFAAAVRRATPDAVLNAVRVLRAVSPHDLMVIDVGGATTDVYSAVEPHGGEAAPEADVVGTLRVARTVEGDLGLRLSALGVVDAASREGLSVGNQTQEWARVVAATPRRVARTAAEREADLDLAGLCAVVSTRRHARPYQVTGVPRPLAEVGTVVASGGVFRREGGRGTAPAMRPVLRDFAGGWQPPEHADVSVDAAYVLAAVGLMASDFPQAAASLAAGLMGVQGR